MKNKQIKQLEEAEALVEKLKAEIEAEKNKVKFIVIDGWAYETKEHDFNKKLSEIKIPEGKELWNVSDFEKFSLEDWNNLNLKKCWFYIKYPFAYNQFNSVAWFYAGSDWAYFNCYRDPSGSDASLGVRFKRKVTK
jgi:hypothetical protein